MAVLRQRLNRKNAAGSYDKVHLETSSEIVVRPDGNNVESSLTDITQQVQQVTTIVNNGVEPGSHAATHSSTGKDPITPESIGAAVAGHSHSEYSAVGHAHNYAGASTPGGAANSAAKLETQRTFKVNLASTTAANFDGTTNATPGVSGILPISNGGTGVNSLNGLKKALDVGSPTITAPTYPGSIPSVGNTMTWAGKTWRVVHKLSGVAILALGYWEKDIKWYTTGYMDEFTGSNIWNECMNFSNSLKLFAANYLIPFSGLPCFIASCDQIEGENSFNYFATQSNRIFKDTSGTAHTWWTGTISNVMHDDAAYVKIDGSTSGSYDTHGFRPFVAIRL